ncbi:MAG: hypothetical protein TE42_08010 [Candidatus Synechococcus spongiarum SP3]|uniref:Uncharacterized protein n=1 Tax=Candidatus Synechococcus spongiarum SP3 TaxID=1604020 RepID=A0A0G2HJS8_9SYNE|nr:MAG: hypothetical protein TE42_08010 [Candidatus Synechococcus spongiarum SP3]
MVLAVGDLFPLLLAWASGLPYGFIGTPKSDWTWLANWGATPVADACHRCKGSERDPWEGWQIHPCLPVPAKAVVGVAGQPVVRQLAALLLATGHQLAPKP